MKIEVEYLQMGQPGSYKPHTYEANITIIGKRLMDHEVRNLVRAVVRNFDDDDPNAADTMANHFRTKLKALELKSSEELEDEPRVSGLPVRREVWYARVENPYTD
jgi:hypothetical protein